MYPLSPCLSPDKKGPSLEKRLRILRSCVRTNHADCYREDHAAKSRARERNGLRGEKKTLTIVALDDDNCHNVYEDVTRTLWLHVLVLFAGDGHVAYRLATTCSCAGIDANLYC